MQTNSICSKCNKGMGHTLVDDMCPECYSFESDCLGEAKGIAELEEIEEEEDRADQHDAELDIELELEDTF